MNLKSQKGSITLFVLVSCLFFLASVACVNMYMQSKQVAVDREYRQIKATYEKDINNMDSIYTELSNKNNLTVNFEIPEINKTDKKVSISVYTNLEYLDIKTLKYGWYYESNYTDKPSTSRIMNWTYVENQNGENEFVATYNYTEETGYYYLCVMVDNLEFWTYASNYITSNMIVHLDGINNVGLGDKNHSESTLIWKNLANTENTDIEDVSIYGATWNKNSLLFDGIDDYAIGHTSTNGDITVEFTGKQIGNSRATMYMINYWGTNATKPSLQLWNNSTSETKDIYERILVPKTEDLLRNEIGQDELTRTNKEFFNYTITKNNERIKTYLNGELSKEYTNTEFIERFNISYINISLGRWYNSNSYYSNQSVNAFRIYNRALTDDDVKQNYYTDKIRFKISD